MERDCGVVIVVKGMVRVPVDSHETCCGSEVVEQIETREGSKKCKQTGCGLFGEAPSDEKSCEG